VVQYKEILKKNQQTEMHPKVLNYLLQTFISYFHYSYANSLHYLKQDTSRNSRHSLYQLLLLYERLSWFSILSFPSEYTQFFITVHLCFKQCPYQVYVLLHNIYRTGHKGFSITRSLPVSSVSSDILINQQNKNNK